MSKMIRISKQAHQHLSEISEETGESMQDLMNKAIDKLMRDYFFHKANKAYAELRQDPEARKAELEERALWDVTLMDGLEDASS